MQGQRPSRPGPPVIHRYEARCDDCPDGRVQSFYSEDERNRFAAAHAVTFHHRLTLTEEILPCRT